MTVYKIRESRQRWNHTLIGCVLLGLGLGLSGCGGGDGTDGDARYVPPSGAVENTNNAGPGSLRQAILDANANPGVDMIDFAIPGAGPHRILLSEALPPLTEAVVIDATTQAGTDCAESQLMVELDGSLLGLGDRGLIAAVGGAVIRGLAIHSFSSDGILIGNSATPSPDPSLVQCTFIGTSPDGTVLRPNGGSGLVVDNAAIEIIGGNRPAEGNLISGNRGYGILVGGFADPQDVVVIAGNRIGTDSLGVADFGNGLDGIRLVDTTAVIGGFVTGAANTLSANDGAGLRVVSSRVEVEGNRIGTYADGTSPLGNRGGGVVLTTGSSGAIGDEQSNLIANNGIAGVWFDDSQAAVRNNRLIDNFAGVLFTGAQVNGQQVGQNNCFLGNAFGVVVNTGTLGFVRADDNWWGDASGPSGEGPGVGDSISKAVEVDRWITLEPPRC